MGVKVIDKSMEFKVKNVLALSKAVAHMALDVERLSKRNVPHDKGTLQNTGRAKKLSLLKHQVTYGISPPASAPYARRWEYERPRGGFKKGRKSGYLRDAARTIARKDIGYFKKHLATIRI